jgi:hypothetical protein
VQIIEEWIGEALRKGYIERGRVRFHHPIFAVPKASGGWRVVVDLRALNPFQKTPKFKLPTLRDAAALAYPKGYAGKVDLCDFFHHIEIALPHRPLLGFRWNGVSYRFAVLPFGSASSPWLATTLLAPAIKELRNEGIRLIVYMDDILILGPSKERTRWSIQRVLQILSEFGWHVNLKKSVLEPTQDLEYLGISFHLGSQLPMLSVPPRKKSTVAHELRRLARRSQVSARLAARVAGLAVSLFPVIRLASTLTRRLHIDIREGMARAPRLSWSTQIRLRQSTARDLLLLADKIVTSRPITLLPPPQLEIRSDASQTGLGAVLMTPDGRRAIDSMSIPVKKPKHINVLELMALWKAIRRFSSKVKGQVVTVRMDSRVALSYVMRGTGRSRPLRRVARRMALWLDQHQVTLLPHYIPGQQNFQADRLSRLHCSAFTLEAANLLKIQGPSSMPFPRTQLIMREAHLMSALQGYLLTPWWPGAPWFPALREMASELMPLPVGLFPLVAGVPPARCAKLAVWSLSSRRFSSYLPNSGVWPYLTALSRP